MKMFLCNFFYSFRRVLFFIAAVSKANKILKDPDEVKKIKHILEEAEATIQLKVSVEIASCLADITKSSEH